jgi:hypothetical protein
VLASIFSLPVSTFAATRIDKISDEEAIETLTSFVHGGINK